VLWEHEIAGSSPASPTRPAAWSLAEKDFASD
jgi:hypothetical protein